MYIVHNVYLGTLLSETGNKYWSVSSILILNNIHLLHSLQYIRKILYNVYMSFEYALHKYRTADISSSWDVSKQINQCHPTILLDYLQQLSQHGVTTRQCYNVSAGSISGGRIIDNLQIMITVICSLSICRFWWSICRLSICRSSIYRLSIIRPPY